MRWAMQKCHVPPCLRRERERGLIEVGLDEEALCKFIIKRLESWREIVGRVFRQGWGFFFSLRGLMIRVCSRWMVDERKRWHLSGQYFKGKQGCQRFLSEVISSSVCGLLYKRDIKVRRYFSRISRIWISFVIHFLSRWTHFRWFDKGCALRWT